MKNKNGFTLVELIVVITILAVLATVGFISFQGYTIQSRDTVRIHDMEVIHKALEFKKVESGNYPTPANLDATTTHWKQGEISKEVLLKLRGVSNVPKDPLTQTPMKYATTLNNKEFEIRYELEQELASKNYQVYAQNHISKIVGNFNGVYVTGNDNTYYATVGLHSSGSTFYIDGQNIDFTVSKIQDSSNNDITPANVENKYPDFSLSLLDNYESKSELKNSWHQELKTLDKTSDYELAEFAIKILGHNPKKLKELGFTQPVAQNPVSGECVDSTTPTDESFFVFDEASGTITDFIYTNPTMANPNPVNVSDLIIPCKINNVDVVHIAATAFRSKNLTSVIFPDSIETIGASAFYNNDISGSVELPPLLTSIEERIFYANNISSISIGDQVTSIGESAFNNNAITDLNISENILNIGIDAFRRNDISNLNIASTNLVIGDFAFIQQGGATGPIQANESFCTSYYTTNYIDTNNLTSCNY